MGRPAPPFTPPARDPTVADWIAEGMATIALHCGCGHYATVRLADLPPTMRRSRLGRNARCAACGKQGAQVMRDMNAHYEAMEATGWSCEPKPWPGNEKPRAGGPGGAEAIVSDRASEVR